MLILVACHDDAEALKQALPRLIEIRRPGVDRLFVIADRCSDETAAVAQSLGAEVLERTDESGGRGKGAALRWALERLPQIEGSAPVAIFDADSEPSARFSAAVDALFGRGGRAGQAYVDPRPARALLSRLAAYSEIVSQRFSDRFRERMGWGVPLRGTGMVIEKVILFDALLQCRTQVEDLELTLILAARGIRAERLSAPVVDPKPESGRGVAAQRARWLAGNLAALGARRREIVRLLRSPEGATLVLSLFAKPRSAFFSIRLILFLILVAGGARGGWTYLEVLLAVFLAKDLFFLFGGLFVVERPGFYLPAVLLSPVYPLMWLVGLWRAPAARKGWLSARNPP